VAGLTAPEDPVVTTTMATTVENDTLPARRFRSCVTVPALLWVSARDGAILDPLTGKDGT
jgi:hypothetical protein